jgi:DNA repair exonuclease SbcCD ATPase subunit
MMSELLEQPFDYSELDEETRTFVTRKTHEIHGLMRRTAEEIILIGENLLLVRQHLPEMKFAAWLRAEFDFSRQSAYNFMRVADKLGGSCKTVLQLPAKVLYELASSSEAIIEQVETGHLSPTRDAIREAKEAERQAREAERRARADVETTHLRLLSLQGEVEAQQTMIARLSQELEEVRQQHDEHAVPITEIKEVEKPVLPSEIKEQLATLEQQLATIMQQRDTLSSRVAELQELAQAEALQRGETDQARRIRLSWYRITNELQRSIRSLLSQWPSPLDVLVFEADDWTRLSQTKALAKRLLEECSALTGGTDKMIIESDSTIAE